MRVAVSGKAPPHASWPCSLTGRPAIRLCRIESPAPFPPRPPRSTPGSLPKHCALTVKVWRASGAHTVSGFPRRIASGWHPYGVWPPMPVRAAPGRLLGPRREQPLREGRHACSATITPTWPGRPPGDADSRLCCGRAGRWGRDGHRRAPTAGRRGGPPDGRQCGDRRGPGIPPPHRGRRSERRWTWRHPGGLALRRRQRPLLRLGVGAGRARAAGRCRSGRARPAGVRTHRRRGAL